VSATVESSSIVEMVEAGCSVCHGDRVEWTAANAVAVAARHRKATGHGTWARQVILTSFGENPPPQDDRLPGIE
jgi:hypothetical protein